MAVHFNELLICKVRFLSDIYSAFKRNVQVEFVLHYNFFSAIGWLSAHWEFGLLLIGISIYLFWVEREKSLQIMEIFTKFRSELLNELSRKMRPLLSDHTGKASSNVVST